MGLARSTSKVRRVPRATAGRRGLIAWFGALAIVFQCVVIQGHFHLAYAGTPAFDQVESTSPAPVQKDKAPGGDPSGCFICQQMAMAGSAVLPDSPAPIVVAASETTTLLPAKIAAIAAAPSHHWRSRAPPIPA